MDRYYCRSYDERGSASWFVRPLEVVVSYSCARNTAEVIDLNDIPYAFGARHAQEKGCLIGTRKSLAEICDVFNNLDKVAPRVCLLTGTAGSGKSAVAVVHTIARLYDRQKRPGSSYCFSRTDVTRESQPKKYFQHCRARSSDHDPSISPPSGGWSKPIDHFTFDVSLREAHYRT